MNSGAVQRVADTVKRYGMTKIGRNSPCPCNSGKKYKHCCLPKDRAKIVQYIPASVEEVWAMRRPIKQEDSNG